MSKVNIIQNNVFTSKTTNMGLHSSRFKFLQKQTEKKWHQSCSLQTKLKFIQIQTNKYRMHVFTRLKKICPQMFSFPWILTDAIDSLI